MKLSPAETQAYYHANPLARSLILFVITVSCFVASLNLSASLVAIPTIARDLQADAIYTSWIPSAYILSNLIALLPGGKLADHYGRKRIYFIGSAIFLVGSLLAGLSPTIEFLLVSRVIQGVGAALLFSTSMALISSIFKWHGRGVALGWLISGVYTGLSIGPWLGGLITDNFGWHAVFLLPAPLILFSLIFAAWKIKSEWHADESTPLDFKGTFLLSAGLCVFFFSIGKMPHWDGWLMAVSGLMLLYAFVNHSNHSANPLIRLKLVWENRAFSRFLGAAMMMYACNYGLMFLLGLYFQYNRGLSAGEAGKLLLLQAVVQAVLAPLAGRLADRYPTRWLTMTGCISGLSGVILLCTLNSQSPLSSYSVVLVLFGIGFGLFSTPNTTAAMASVSEKKLGVASALLNMSRVMGQMFGTAIVTLLLAWFIGQQKITPALHGDLLNTLMAYAAVCSVFLVLAIWFSNVKLGRVLGR